MTKSMFNVPAINADRRNLICIDVDVLCANPHVSAGRKIEIPIIAPDRSSLVREIANRNRADPDTGSVVLDLTRAVTASGRAAVRNALPVAAMLLDAMGIKVLVRIERPQDIRLAALPCVSAIVLPAIRDIGGGGATAAFRRFERLIDRVEARVRLPPGHLSLVATMHRADAVEQLHAPAAALPRLTGVAIGIRYLPPSFVQHRTAMAATF
ncbi:MAG: hypothetical protein ACLGJC_11450 [Alphaproteobacteria bacterium]